MLYALGAQDCLIMPERMAATPATQQISEYVGSGPFRFLRDKWVAGGETVHFDRVEWIVQPDPATAAAALQTGEVDWVEQPLIDLVGSMKPMPGVQAASYDRLGLLAMVVVNHLHPPFDNPAVLQAIISAIDQKDYVDAVVGDQTELGVTPAGFFVVGAPLASRAGLEALTAPRSIDAARAAIRQAGYKGERITLMAPSDLASLMALAQVTRELWTKLGLNVDFQIMDWGTLVSRRAKQDSPDQGGWNAFCTTWSGLAVTNPGSSFPLQAIGRKGWLGWYSNPKMVALHDRWFEASDLAAQKAVCEDMQREAFANPPFLPLGQWKQPGAFRNNLKNFVRCGNVLFWGVERAYLPGGATNIVRSARRRRHRPVAGGQDG